VLLEVTIENFALIDRLRLNFGPGLNVLTGETGAGKSVLIDAVEVALGGRASAEAIRTGADHAYLEVVFDLSRLPEVRALIESPGAGQDPLVLSRELSRTGRNVARINGRTATAAMVREITQHLLDLHGQHEHQSLLRPERQLDLLDDFGGEAVAAARERVRELVARFRELRRELAGLAGDARERARRVDLLAFQVREIDEARLQPREEAALVEEQRILENSGRLLQTAAEAYARLYEGGGPAAPAAGRVGLAGRGQVPPGGPPVVDVLGAVLHQLRAAQAIDPALGGPADILETAATQVQEVARALRQYRDGLEFEPARLEAVARRLDLLAELRRKYGDSVADVLAYREQAAAELERLRNAESLARDLEEEIENVRVRLGEAAWALHRLRKAAARELEERLAAELQALGMSRARVVVEFGWEPDPDGVAMRPASAQQGSPGAAGPAPAEPPPAEPVPAGPVAVGPRGADRVEYLFTANPGEPPRPLAKVASGGELSRLMLALKTVLAEADRIPTVIFDEVDAGVGGRAAVAVAERLAHVARARQVLCVTHLPQIASLADRHLAVSKEVRGDRTVTAVRLLDEGERVEEVARMLGATAPDGAPLEHARTLVEGGRRARRRRAAGQ